MDDKFKFDVVIGNPPYHEKIIGSNNKEYSRPIYNYFMDEAYKVGRIVEMIHPARFLFNAGSTPKSWNRKILSNINVKILFYDSNGSNVFKGTDIKGGIAVSYKDDNKKLGPIGVFTPFKELRSVLNKIYKRNDFKTISNIVFAPENYKFTNQMHLDYPGAYKKLSNGHKFDLKSNVFNTLSDIFLDNPPNDGKKYIKIYGLYNKHRAFKYIYKGYISNNSNLNGWKVFVPKANGSGAIGEVISTPLIGKPLIGNTQTFISIGNFKNEKEAINLFKYIKTKFARALLGVLKVTQDNTSEKWKYVPLQNFSSNSDVDWSQSIHDIDKQLYKKYDLSTDEINFIETKVKEMK